MLSLIEIVRTGNGNTGVWYKANHIWQVYHKDLKLEREVDYGGKIE